MEPARIRSSAAVAGTVLIVDQLAKAGAAHAATPAHNPDLAFGVVGGPTLVLVFATIAVLGVFVAVLGRWAGRLGIPALIPALIAGGVLGNALDRARFGAVRDFIHTPFAIINLADIAVTVGIVTFAIAFGLRLRSTR